MWLINSSIGRKLVMSITGTALVLFLFFHASMNLTLLFSEDAYNWICSMLGARWYAVAASAILGLCVLIHFVYAFILSYQNKKARGNDPYEVTARQEGVDWASKNMLLIGIIIVMGLLLHLYNFWFKMQFAELTGIHTSAFDPQDGAALVRYTFSNPWYCLAYLVWLFFLWLHLTHGIWSAMQTMGLSNTKWLPRIKVIGNVLATIVVLMFASVVCYYFGMWLGTTFS